MPQKVKEINTQESLDKVNQLQALSHIPPAQKEPDKEPILRQPPALPDNFEFQIEYYDE